MIVNIDISRLTKDVESAVKYSIGFLEGAKSGKPLMLDNIGQSAVEMLKNFIDSNARTNPQALHHVYEWYETGSPYARLFDITYKVVGDGLSMNYTLSQSKSIERGSTVPFYDKARIMENGIPVIIEPKKARALHFQVDGQDVFSKSPITVNDPGGVSVQGSLEKTIDDFFQNFFSQSFIYSSGLKEYLEKPEDYSKNFGVAKSGETSFGFNVGRNWIAKAGK